MDTKDILFICGGAFIDLDRQVSERTHEASLGFGNPVRHALCTMDVSALRFVHRVVFDLRLQFASGNGRALRCSQTFYVVYQVRARRRPGAIADATITREEGALQVEQV